MANKDNQALTTLRNKVKDQDTKLESYGLVLNNLYNAATILLRIAGGQGPEWAALKAAKVEAGSVLGGEIIKNLAEKTGQPEDWVEEGEKDTALEAAQQLLARSVGPFGSDAEVWALNDEIRAFLGLPVEPPLGAPDADDTAEEGLPSDAEEGPTTAPAAP